MLTLTGTEDLHKKPFGEQDDEEELERMITSFGVMAEQHEQTITPTLRAYCVVCYDEFTVDASQRMELWCSQHKT